MNMSFDFGKWLIETRHEHNLSQDKLAELILIEPENISKYERGKAMPNLSTINRVCECMGYEVQIVQKNAQILENFKS